jgi:hypothetical protein
LGRFFRAGSACVCVCAVGNGAHALRRTAVVPPCPRPTSKSYFAKLWQKSSCMSPRSAPRRSSCCPRRGARSLPSDQPPHRQEVHRALAGGLHGPAATPSAAANANWLLARLSVPMQNATTSCNSVTSGVTLTPSPICGPSLCENPGLSWLQPPRPPIGTPWGPPSTPPALLRPPLPQPLLWDLYFYLHVQDERANPMGARAPTHPRALPATAS